jgi:hypothetical protein
MLALSDSHHDFGKGERCNNDIIQNSENIKKGFKGVFHIGKEGEGKIDEYGQTHQNIANQHRSSYFFDHSYKLDGIQSRGVEDTFLQYVAKYYPDAVDDVKNGNFRIEEDTFAKRGSSDTSDFVDQIFSVMFGETKPDGTVDKVDKNEIGNIGLIYDQCALKDVVEKLTTDYIQDIKKKRDTSDVKGHIFNINPICGRWDEAGKSYVKRIDVSINIKSRTTPTTPTTVEKVPIPHTRGIRFNMKADLDAVATTADTVYTIEDNKVVVFDHTGWTPITGKYGGTRNPNEFTLRELSKNLFSFSVASLCDAYSAANPTPKKDNANAATRAAESIVDLTKLMGPKGKSLGLDAAYIEKIKSFFKEGSLFNEKFNFLHVKRSADYGQVYLVKALNDSVVDMYAYNFYDKNKRLHKNGKYPYAEKLPTGLIRKWVLLTGDILCYLRARLEKVPCIFYKHNQALLLYKGETGITEKPDPADVLYSQFSNVFDQLNQLATLPMTNRVKWSITYTKLIELFKGFHSKIVDQENPMLFQEEKKVMKPCIECIKKLVVDLDVVFDKVMETIGDISTLFQDLQHENVHDIVAYYRQFLRTDNIDADSSKIRIREPNDNPQEDTTLTLDDFKYILAFSKCMAAVNEQVDGATIPEAWIDVLQELHIYSPVFKKGNTHVYAFLLQKDLTADMKEMLLLSRNKKNTVQNIIKDWLVLLNKPFRTERGATTTRKKPIECYTYVLETNIISAIHEVNSLNERLEQVKQNVQSTMAKLNRELIIIQTDTLQNSMGSQGRLSNSGSTGSSPMSERSLSNDGSPGKRQDPKLASSLAIPKTQREGSVLPTTVFNGLSLLPNKPPSAQDKPPSAKKGGGLENYKISTDPSYFSLHSHLCTSEIYLYHTFITQDDIIDIQQTINSFFNHENNSMYYEHLSTQSWFISQSHTLKNKTTVYSFRYDSTPPIHDKPKYLHELFEDIFKAELVIRSVSEPTEQQRKINAQYAFKQVAYSAVMKLVCGVLCAFETNKYNQRLTAEESEGSISARLDHSDIDLSKSGEMEFETAEPGNDLELQSQQDMGEEEDFINIYDACDDVDVSVKGPDEETFVTTFRNFIRLYHPAVYSVFFQNVKVDQSCPGGPVAEEEVSSRESRKRKCPDTQELQAEELKEQLIEVIQKSFYELENMKPSNDVGVEIVHKLGNAPIARDRLNVRPINVKKRVEFKKTFKHLHAFLFNYHKQIASLTDMEDIQQFVTPVHNLRCRISSFIDSYSDDEGTQSQGSQDPYYTIQPGSQGSEGGFSLPFTYTKIRSMKEYHRKYYPLYYQTYYGASI